MLLLTGCKETKTDAQRFAEEYKTMTEYIEKVNASATSTEALNHQINDLSKRMTALNTVYGNMLSAMNVKS